MSSTSLASTVDAALKRQPRAKPRRSLPRDSLQIIPEVSEDEGSVSSCSSDPCSTSKHQRRRAQITPADTELVQTVFDSCLSPTTAAYNDILSFILPPRQAPVPSSPTSSTHSGFSVWLDDMDHPLRFPRTPSFTPQNDLFPSCSSPTPSLTDCSSPEGRSTGLPVTPGTSDDEMHVRPRAPVARRVTIKPLVIVKNTKTQPAYQPESESESEEEEEDSAWYARELGQVVSLCSSGSECVLPPARADSMTRRRSRKALPLPPRRVADVPSSALLHPGHHRRRSIKSPTRAVPPPPPPKTVRPPPRVSVPADFDFDMELSQSVLDLRSPVDVPVDAMPFSPDVNVLDFSFKVHNPLHLPLSLPSDSMDLHHEIASSLVALRHEEDEHVLRSRWSSSTLSTVREQDASVTSKLLNYFGGSPKRAHKGPRKSNGSSSSASPPPSPLPKTSRESHRSGKKSRGKHSPSSSVSSQESSTSGGLRRKPIPLEFLRASTN